MLQYSSLVAYHTGPIEDKIINLSFANTVCFSYPRTIISNCSVAVLHPFFTSIQNSVFRHIPSLLFPEPRAVSLMCQYRNRFYLNTDHTRRIRKERDITKSDSRAQKMCRMHAVCILLYGKGWEPFFLMEPWNLHIFNCVSVRAI